MNDILFASVKLNDFDRKDSLNKILSVDKKYWFWDTYRSTNMLPLMTKNSITGKEGASNYREGDFFWLDYTPISLRDWFESEVFPWMKTKTRVMALLTVPNFANKEHIDCKLDEVGARQHKFRVVLQGKTDTLYFKTRYGDQSAPDINEPFIMDGGWPHGMKNDSDQLKLTIAAGAPWNGLDTYDNINILMRKKDYELPDNLEKFLDK